MTFDTSALRQGFGEGLFFIRIFGKDTEDEAYERRLDGIHDGPANGGATMIGLRISPNDKGSTCRLTKGLLASIGLLEGEFSYRVLFNQKEKRLGIVTGEGPYESRALALGANLRVLNQALTDNGVRIPRDPTFIKAQIGVQESGYWGK